MALGRHANDAVDLVNLPPASTFREGCRLKPDRPAREGYPVQIRNGPVEGLLERQHLWTPLQQNVVRIGRRSRQHARRHIHIDIQRARSWPGSGNIQQLSGCPSQPVSAEPHVKVAGPLRDAQPQSEMRRTLGAHRDGDPSLRRKRGRAYHLDRYPVGLTPHATRDIQVEEQRILLQAARELRNERDPPRAARHAA